ncbi:ribonuclease H2, subunit C [Cristinia sonorae]|uniref:Ribonuclease H2, subunit C n=1 Tax=Cristinia sonorae TaxID=1940300 RepID=A0A8K0UIW4_9AGAR|nr:ribonuclease H2, subunit C [Cristinia sonorae]
MTAALYLESPKTPLHECSPNLMPFHIGYSGPAPISTYFRVKPAPAPTFGSLKEETPAETLPDKETEGAVTESQETDIDDALTDPNPTITASASSSATLVNDVEMATEGLSKVSLQRHYVAAFRGRAMHGLEVDLPEGYSGLVFRSPPANEKPTGSKKDGIPESRKKGVQPQTGRPRRQSRAPVEEAEEGVEDADMHNGAEDDELRRVLRPQGTFSSFRLWNPDIPVDEGRDEYIRSLTEWTKLAAEIHRYED